MGYLKQLDIENFKSWRGKQIIGPFLQFNCIIGTNGSGKSNVMDALSFVMGERVSSLRVKHLKDLIHGAHVGRPVSNTARVAMRYCSDEEEETVFCRIITRDSSEYHINGLRVTFAKYVEELEKIGILTKAQNCLVFQVNGVHSFEGPKGENQDAGIDQSVQRIHTQFHFNKKKSATVERKQVSQEKIEAQKYQALLDELHQSHLQLSLAELYHNEQGISALSDTLKKRQEAAAAMNSKLLIGEQTVKTQKKEHGRLAREQQHIDKEICTQEQILSQSQSQYIKAKVNTSHHVKKADDLRDALKKSQRMFSIKEQELEEHQQEISQLKRSWRNYEKQVQEQGAARGRDIELDMDQSERYKELKELALKQGGVLSQQAEKLHWEVKADWVKIAFDERRKKEIENAIKYNQTQLEDLTCRAEKLEEYTKTCKSSLEEYQQQEESLSAELQRGHQRTKEVNQELNQVMEELGNACLDKQENKRQLQHKELLEKLRRLYPETVYGRLSDLCSPIHKKYQLAVTKVFGRYMNAIVVASEKVARDCITFIKEERRGRETFLPIDNLILSPLNERLREMPGAKMVVDVVQVIATTVATQLRKVVQFVCGNTLVCETVKEARSMAFDGQERFKTVSLEGTMFEKSGVISGGSSNLRTKARCWEEKDMLQLKERKTQLTTELRDLMRLKRKELDLKQIVAQAQGAQTRLKYSKNDLENLRKKNIPKCQAHSCSLPGRLQREVMTTETAIEQKRLTRHNLLLACKIKNLPISLLSGSLNEISEVQLDTDSESTTATMDIYEREARLVIDYSELETELKVKNRAAYLFSIGVLCTKAARKCNQEFQQVRSQRLHLFSQCFEHVSVIIDQVYKRICRNNSAQAILSAENPEEPYLGGINYNCVAPGKRFMSMDNLSGGEKAIAALAFIFAIHRLYYFCIFTKYIFANIHCLQVTSFIREESRENMQIIIISLKEEFFSKADALLGVYSDFDECMFSCILTLDLRPYPLVEDDNGKQTDKEPSSDKRQD
uniref:Structural maintenance of chromosomes protein 1B-like n=1 Tax=Neolamprologus brichardi TaxID=32507 RepID=A0A3Q4MUB8_NEOBR